MVCYDMVSYNVVINSIIFARSISESKFDISPIPATKEDSLSELMGSPFFMPFLSFGNERFTANRELMFEVRYCRFSVSTFKPGKNGQPGSSSYLGMFYPD